MMATRSPRQGTSLKVCTVDPNPDTGALLPGAQFADAFRVTVDGHTLDAGRAAERMLGRSPRWIEKLLALRNFLVAPFGRKTGAPKEPGRYDIIGLFPVVSQTPDRLVGGFDDKHLDFRVAVDVATSGDSQEVTATTLVLTHNLLGQIYLATILPFHRLVVRSLLRQVAA